MQGLHFMVKDFLSYLIHKPLLPISVCTVHILDPNALSHYVLKIESVYTIHPDSPEGNVPSLLT